MMNTELDLKNSEETKRVRNKEITNLELSDDLNDRKSIIKKITQRKEKAREDYIIENV